MLPAEQTFTAYLFRPYIDLGPVVEHGPLHPWGIELAYRSLVEARAYPWMYIEQPPSFRERLLQVTGLTAYRVHDPRELTPELRTPRWQHLCDTLDQYDALPLLTQWRVMRLLGKLGLYQALLDRIPVLSGEGIARGELAAEMAYLRALARFVISQDGDGQFDLSEFELVATHAPRASLVRIHALNQMVVQHAKLSNDGAAVAFWLPLYLEEIQLARPELDEALYTQQMSRHHRAAGFLPQMRGDRTGVVREMDRCQHYAERMPRDTFEVSAQLGKPAA